MPEKVKLESKRDDGVELENQFILRLPEEPSKVLREAIKEGANSLKERLSIRLDNDLRFGEVRFDQWQLHAKVVDIPTVIEALKSVDLKSFYKTADISQMMICKTEPEEQPIEEESPNKNKKKDPNKVDKKFLYPHGITPPLKNVRKRRFRKTLKKKFVEAPEIEKEVKRLLRIDNDAVKVSWEIITEEEDPKQSKSDDQPGTSKSKGKGRSKKDNDHVNDNENETQGASREVGLQDIFGAEVSDSDEEETNIDIRDIDENSRLSGDDSRMSDSNSMHFQGTSEKMATEFSQSMFNSSADSPPNDDMYKGSEGDSYYDGGQSQDLRDVSTKLDDLEQEVAELKAQRMQKEQEISSIENQTLRKRLQDNLDSLSNQIREKEQEMLQLQSLSFLN